MSLIKSHFQLYKEQVYDSIIDHKPITIINHPNYQGSQVVNDVCQIFNENPKFIVQEVECLFLRSFEDVLNKISFEKTVFTNDVDLYFNSLNEELKNQRMIIWFKNFDALYYDKYHAADLRKFSKFFIENPKITPIFHIDDGTKSTQPFLTTLDVFNNKTNVISLLEIDRDRISNWIIEELTSKNISYKRSQIDFLLQTCLSSDVLVRAILKDCIEKGKFSKNNMKKSLNKFLDFNKNIYDKRLKQYSMIQLNVLKCILDEDIEQLMSKSAFKKYAFSGSASIIRALNSFENKGIIIRKSKSEIYFTDPLFRYYLTQLIR